MADNEQKHPSSYGGSSPIFDVPEFPPLRRVVPLPKRRRTVIDATLEHAREGSGPLADNLGLGDRGGEAQTATTTTTSTSTSEDVASALSTSMALSSYYMPLFHGGSDIFKDDIDPRHVNPTELLTQANGIVNIGYGIAEGREDGDREGGYMDHLTQPGNTKKRKVPVAAHARGGDDPAPDGSEDLPDGAFLADRGVAEVVNVVPPVPPPLTIPPKRGKFSRATQAGLQLKEMLKSRKRQLAAVLGAFSHNDSLALDQALATAYPSFGRRSQGRDGRYVDGPPVRLSRRRHEKGKTRAITVANRKALPAPSVTESVVLPECTFSFAFDSITSERVRATSEEVAFLQGRFDAEFARQAARAAEAARQAALVVSQMQKTKRGEHPQQHGRISGQTTGASGDSNQVDTDKMVTSSKKSKVKKKKRSALANASNPHHLRNYVPSRLPNSGLLHSTQTTINLQSYLGPFPLRFLSASLPPRKRSAGAPPPSVSLTNPEDEWICPFCEYNLFFGDVHSYRRAIRQRKKILSRRRRAMERAAAAAAGRKKGVMSPDREEPAGDELTDEYDVPSPEVPAASKYVEVREGQDRDRDKGGGVRGRL